MPYLFIAGGVYLISFALIIDTNGAGSGIIFRILPGMIGVGNLIAGLKMATFI